MKQENVSDISELSSRPRVESHPGRPHAPSSAYVKKECYAYDFCAWNRSYADAADDETSEGGLGGEEMGGGRAAAMHRQEVMEVEDEDEDEDEDQEDEDENEEEEEEEWDEEDVLSARLQEVQKMTEEARKDRKTMLRRLGLVNGQGNARAFRGQPCNVSVSRDYVIDGWDSQRSLMRINYEHTLSLRPEILGLLMGIDFTGPIPDQRTSQGKFEELEEFILDDRKKRPCRTGTFRGLCPDSLEPRLRNYIRKRRPMLGFTNSDRQLSQTQVYAFKEELYFNKRFNWVASRVQRVEAVLARSGRKCKLSYCLKGFLSAYIHTALNYQRAGLNEPGEADNRVENVVRGRRGGVPPGPSRKLEQHSANTVEEPLGADWLETWKDGTIMKKPKREFPEDDVVVEVEVEQGYPAAAKIRKVETRLHLGNRLKDLERDFNVEKAKNSVIVSRISNLEAQREMEVVKRNRAEMMVTSMQAADLRVREVPGRQSSWVATILERLKSFVRSGL